MAIPWPTLAPFGLVRVTINDSSDSETLSCAIVNVRVSEVTPGWNEIVPDRPVKSCPEVALPDEEAKLTRTTLETACDKVILTAAFLSLSSMVKSSILISGPVSYTHLTLPTIYSV